MIEKTIYSLEMKGYQVKYFENRDDALEYLKKTIQGKTIGFGGSQTLKSLHLQEILSQNNKVWNPDDPEKGKGFIETALEAITAELYFVSVNALTENGEIVNLDSEGNRLAGSSLGHEKVYYIAGTNKITKDIEQAIWRVRNVAAPMNAMRLKLNTPCAIRGDRCYDCKHPDRICNGLLIILNKLRSCEAEVVIIDEELGY